MLAKMTKLENENRDLEMQVKGKLNPCFILVTRPDTRLPKSRAGGQGPFLRSPDHLGRGSEVKK